MYWILQRLTRKYWSGLDLFGICVISSILQWALGHNESAGTIIGSGIGFLILALMLPKDK